MDTPTLTFEDNGGALYAFTPRCSYMLQRDYIRVPGGIQEVPGWVATATVDHATGRTDLQREYTIERATLDGAMLACRLAERDGFDSWSASADTPNTSADGNEAPRPWTAADWSGVEADRCEDCGTDLPPGDEPCRRCAAIEAAERDNDRSPAASTPADDRVLLAIVEDGGDPGTSLPCEIVTLATFLDANDWIASEPGLVARLRGLKVGESWSDGGGAAAWFAVVRLPWFRDLDGMTPSEAARRHAMRSE